MTGADVANADKRALAEVQAPPAPVAAVEPKKIDLGTIAAIGVAIGGIGTLVGALLAVLFGLGVWLPFGVLALLMMISGPSMLLAWLKLRRRNLGPILDANGWAINGRARINVACGAAMTELPVLPAGAKRTLDDPFADKKTPWRHADDPRRGARARGRVVPGQVRQLLARQPDVGRCARDQRAVVSQGEPGRAGSGTGARTREEVTT